MRTYACQEALRIASSQDDLYAARIAMGQTADKIAEDAEMFFARLCPGDQTPECFNEEDYRQLKLLRDQWV